MHRRNALLHDRLLRSPFLTKKHLAVCNVKLSDFSLDAVRYAAYAVSGPVFVFLKMAGKNTVTVELASKKNPPAPEAVLKSGFLAELADEKLREAVAGGNRELREFLILKALSGPEKPAEAQDPGLTAEQEKELEDLIAQVEKEIKQDSRTGKSTDPLDITRTWEDKYGAKNRKK